MYPPFASLFHDKSTGKSTAPVSHMLRVQILFKPELTSVDGETVVLHSEDYKFLLIYPHIFKTHFHLLRDIMNSNDDLLPVGLNLCNIALASQRSRMKYHLGLILSFCHA